MELLYKIQLHNSLINIYSKELSSVETVCEYFFFFFSMKGGYCVSERVKGQEIK